MYPNDDFLSQPVGVNVRGLPNTSAAQSEHVPPSASPLSQNNPTIRFRLEREKEPHVRIKWPSDPIGARARSRGDAPVGAGTFILRSYKKEIMEVNLRRGKKDEDGGGQ